MARMRVFLDTNVIIESFRIGVWSALSQTWTLETVHKCEEEALTGETSRPGRVAVDVTQLRKGLAQSYPVGRAERNKLIAAHPLCSSMDDGEKDLYAYLYAHENPLPPLIVVSTADKGAIVRAKDLSWLDRLISLEELLDKSGVTRNQLSSLGDAYSKDFLATVRKNLILGVIP